MPIPSASSKIFWLCANFFENVHIFLTAVKSDILLYKFPYLNMQSKVFDKIQSFESSQKTFWPADGLGMIESIKPFTLKLIFDPKFFLKKYIFFVKEML